MSGVRIVRQLLQGNTDVTNSNIVIAFASQSTRFPFIVLSHVYESQIVILEGSVSKFNTRVSVGIHGDNAIQVDRITERVKLLLSSVRHATITDGDSPPTDTWQDVSILKAGADMLDYDDERTSYRRVIDWYVDWKSCA